jgi:hypothetical protein
MVDANFVKVHRHGDRGKRGTKSQAMGKSKGGLTTKILAQGSPRQSGALCFIAGTTPRHGRRRADPRHGVRRPHRRQSFCFELDYRRHERNWRASCHFAAPAAQTPARYRHGRLQMAAFDRKFLPQNQRVQTHLHARRQNRPKLRRHDLCRLRRHQFSMNLSLSAGEASQGCRRARLGATDGGGRVDVLDSEEFAFAAAVGAALFGTAIGENTPRSAPFSAWIGKTRPFRKPAAMISVL